MAPEPQPPVLADAGPDSAIRRLLVRQAQLTDQQAEVQAQLAALLPSKYRANIKLETLMLRHKLHALRAYAALHGTTLRCNVFFFEFSTAEHFQFRSSPPGPLFP